jgi:mannose-6-phosphate isomerase class I
MKKIEDYTFYFLHSSNHSVDWRFYLMSVLDGEGSVETSEGTFAFKKGDHFIIPSTMGEYKMVGEASVIVSHVTGK